MMKKTLAILLALTVIMSFVSAFADSSTRQDIIDKFPGFAYNAESSTLTLEDFDLHNAPELVQDGNYVYAIVADGAAPTMVLTVGNPELMIDTVCVITTYNEYTIKFNEFEMGKPAAIFCSPTGKCAGMLEDMIESDQVTIVLKNAVSLNDTKFTLNEAQHEMLRMCYEYYMSVYNNTEAGSLTMVDMFVEGTAPYSVSVEAREIKAQNLMPDQLYVWCGSYLDDRFPGIRQPDDRLAEVLEHIHVQGNTVQEPEMLEQMLRGFESQEAVYAVLDSLIRPAEDAE